jgi:Zn-dependent protease with chaperone function
LNDSGLATVMGHEVSHALANHGAQREASQLQQLGAVGVAVATGGKVNKHNKYGVKPMD